MRIAGYAIIHVQAGRFKLDGGGLFGVVPQLLWRRQAAPDEQNRLTLGASCLLLDGHGRRVLIETGLGGKLSAKDRDIYGVADGDGRGVDAVLADRGVSPDSIDAVVLTHLHFDHAGGATRLDAAGRSVPAFPNARVFVQRQEWADAQANRSHMRTTYRPENLAPLADLLAPVDGAAEILPNVRVEPTPGHTFGHQAIFVGDGEQTLCFIGDTATTSWHLRPFWTTAFDILPASVNEHRRALIERAIHERWIVVFPHDLATPAVRISADAAGRWTTTPVDL